MEGLLRLVVCEVAVGDGTMTVYHCDDSLADCAADLPLSDHGNDVDNDDEVASDGEDLLPQESTPSLELFFPFSTRDPQLTDEEMSNLTHVGDHVP